MTAVPITEEGVNIAASAYAWAYAKSNDPSVGAIWMAYGSNIYAKSATLSVKDYVSTIPLNIPSVADSTSTDSVGIYDGIFIGMPGD